MEGGGERAGRCGRHEEVADAEVVRRCLGGDAEAFALLVARYQDRVYTLAYRLLGHSDDALDAAQEAFIRAYAALDRFDTRRPMAPWLLRIAANVAYGMLRKRAPGQLSLDALSEGEADAALARSPGAEKIPAADPEQRVTRAASDAAIRDAVLALPEPYRTVTLLHYLEEMPYETIAAALEMPLGTVKTYLHRARQRLKAVLGERGDR